MSEYLHGAYGQVQAVGSRLTIDSQSALVLIGTAPVNTVEGGANNVNKPIVVRNMAEARKYFGDSTNWTTYTLCEAFHYLLEVKGVAPLVVINVLDPAIHKASTKTTVAKTPSNGRVILTSAGSVILDTIEVKTGTSPNQTTKVKGTDYSLTYDYKKARVIIQELTAGALGTAELTVEYYAVDTTSLTDTTVIGTTDGLGANTGIYAVQDVYPATGMIPAFLMAPGWSQIPAVHTALYQNSQKINGHWDAFIFADLPLLNSSTPLTFETVATYKAANGYDKENEKVFFPKFKGTDGKIYFGSVLYAGNFLELLAEYDGIPWHTASNTECAIISSLYMGAGVYKVFDDKIINEKLNKNGITSAAFVGGRWALWGAHSAAYNPTDADSINVAETNTMMLFYISNDFQQRRVPDVDRPMTANDLQSIVAEEQSRLDALASIGALIGTPVAAINADEIAQSDVYQGDFSFTFDVTTTPLAKSLTAKVNWTDDGFVTYFENLQSDLT